MKLSRFIKELIFPRWCCGCNSYGTLICPKCFSKLEFDSYVYTEANQSFSIAALLVFGSVSQSIIFQLKYASVKEISQLCARMMFLYGTIPECDVITSIPLHPYRENSRGFNQAEEIAQQLASLLQKPYITCLKRVKHTTNLASIKDPEKREQLIKQQFEVHNNALPFIVNKNILIIDDVWTTGSTLKEAARTLQTGNPLAIHSYTFAHGQ